MLTALAKTHDCIVLWMPTSISKYLQVPVNDILLVQILNCEKHLSCIESGTFLWKPVDNTAQAMYSNLRLCHKVP